MSAEMDQKRAMGFCPSHGFQNQTRSFLFVAGNAQQPDTIWPQSCARGEVLTGDRQIWSGNESYPLPSKSCEDLCGAPKRAQGVLIGVGH